MLTDFDDRERHIVVAALLRSGFLKGEGSEVAWSALHKAIDAIFGSGEIPEPIWLDADFPPDTTYASMTESEARVLWGNR